MTEPFYAGEFQTKEEWDEKVKYLLERISRYSKFTDDQRELIKKTIKEFEGYREGYWFKHRDHDCCVTIDDMGKWRIYTKPLENEAMPYDIIDHYDYYACSNDAGFGLDGFPLRLWNYSDKIGLDDFIGVNVLSEYSWNDYFEGREEFISALRWKGKSKSKIKIIKRESMIKLCKHLVDCIISYQKDDMYKLTVLRNEAEQELDLIKQRVGESFNSKNVNGLTLLVANLENFRRNIK